MKRYRSILLITVMIAASMLLAGCDDGPVGYWQIDEISTGGVVMTNDDATNIGLSSAGSVKLQKSGKCVVDILADENEGTWTQSDDGTLTIDYGVEELILSGTIDEDGVMTLEDPQGSTYTLSKP